MSRLKVRCMPAGAWLPLLGNGLVRRCLLGLLLSCCKSSSVAAWLELHFIAVGPFEDCC